MTPGKTTFLGAVLVLAFALRLVGLDFGLPHTQARPDEEVVLEASASIAREGTPRFFNYPSLYPNLLLAAMAGRYAFGRFSGEFSGTQGLVDEIALSPQNFILLDRMLVVGFGTATVWLAFLLARRLWGRDDAGIVAALLLAVAYLHVRESHFGTVDIPLTFFALLGTIACLRAMERPGVRTLVVAGLTAGLTTSIKYNGLALAVPLALAAYLGADPLSSTKRTVRMRGGRLVVAAGCMLLGFLFGTPYLLWDWNTFVGDASFELTGKMSAGSFLGVDLGRGWIRHIVFSLRHGVGAPMLLAGLYGCVLGLRQRDTRVLLITAAFPFCWWLAVGVSGTVFVRYALPLVPYVAVFAAGALCHWVEFATRRTLTPAVAWVVVLSVVGGTTLANSLRFDSLLSRPDSRVLAANWIVESIPMGSTVGEDGDYRGNYGRLRMPEGFVRLLYENGRWLNPASGQEHEGLPDVVVLRKYPLVYERKDTVLREFVTRNDYRVALHIEALPDDGRYEFDEQDAFYLPYAGLTAANRPGPNIEMWTR